MLLELTDEEVPLLQTALYFHARVLMDEPHTWAQAKQVERIMERVADLLEPQKDSPS